ncbi:hypothetical protein B0H17DRAFT_1204085 [Mycena rosella]|uniref:Uncharacterized protein n=1 Tax=Mycena rosella TaxID=1033263 RepID=A0AAD7DA45_MYCRO|nr:hypothetical protein B0H17DRAFT_1204085 [Mycena rosella]
MHNTDTPLRHREWLSIVNNPSTPTADPYQPNQFANPAYHHHGDLYSFDPFSNISTPSFEPATFNYEESLGDVVQNMYGQPYRSDDEHITQEPSSEKELPSSVHRALMNDRAAANTATLTAQDPGRFQKPKNARRKQGDADKENQNPGDATIKKKTKFRVNPRDCQVLTEAVYDSDPYSAGHGQILKSWDEVAAAVHRHRSLTTMKVPAMRVAMDRLLQWHHDPETDEGAQVADVLKGTREEISLGALLDKISEAKERAEGRTEEQKSKAAKKDDYDKRGGEAIRLNSLKNMRRQGSPAAPTSPRHYIPPAKKEVIDIESDDADISHRSSPERTSTPDVQELPPPVKKRKVSSRPTDGRAPKRSRSSRDMELMLDPLLQAFRDGQEQQRRTHKSLEKRMAEGVEKQNEAIREQTSQYVGVFTALAESLKKN